MSKPTAEQRQRILDAAVAFYRVQDGQGTIDALKLAEAEFADALDALSVPLKTRIAALEAALAPFAEVGAKFFDRSCAFWYDSAQAQTGWKHFRNAAQVLRKEVPNANAD